MGKTAKGMYINDDLWEALKLRASRERRTITAIIEMILEPGLEAELREIKTTRAAEVSTAHQGQAGIS